MKIEHELAHGLQLQILGMYRDCYDEGMFSSWPGDLRQSWQTGVDVLYRFAVSGLIRSGCEPPTVSDTKPEDLEFIRRLANNNPYDQYLADLGPSDEQSQWHQHSYWLTPKGKALVDRHELRNYHGGNVCQAFVEELEEIFEQSGAPWSQEPLIPIRPAREYEISPEHHHKP